MPDVLTVNGHTPVLAPGVHLASSAVVARDVHLAAGVNVWFGTVVRSERERITVGEATNLQDGAVVHADPGLTEIPAGAVAVGVPARVRELPVRPSRARTSPTTSKPPGGTGTPQISSSSAASGRG